MKANELMLGDWVAYRRDFPDRVNAIAIGGHAVSLEHDSWQQMSSIYPIPITPEILEKNGFIKTYDNVYSIYQFRDESYSIMVQILSDNKYGVEIHNTISEKDDKGRNDLVTFARDWCSEIFIHELQHALRLCKIEKKIEL